jgi:prepilin-type N-terminal cleavage/methylation domain-containing protein
MHSKPPNPQPLSPKGRGEKEARLRRDGFTLIELLTVIAIIAVLMALSASAVIKFIGVQEKSNTQNGLNKLGPIVKSAWVRAYEKAHKNPLPTNNATVNSLSGGDTARARVIWDYLQMRAAFPMSFNEVFNIGQPAGAFGDSYYQSQLQRLGIGGSTATTAPYENAACLLMALQRRESGGAVTADDLGSSSTKLFAVGNGNEIAALVDGWGNPLFFIRWPTGFQALNPGGPLVAPAGKGNDPLDPFGYLANQTWANGNKGGNRTTFTALFHPLPTVADTSFLLQPLIVSAGPDGQLGLDGNGDVLNAAQANDNLYSYQQH